MTESIVKNTKKDFLNSLENVLSEDRLDWNQYFMGIAILAKQRSSCHRLKVGCVIVKNNRVICMGYNGHLPNSPHISIVVDNHEQATVHAEQNAISDAASRGVSVQNAIAYITHYPCINCFKILVSAHIKTIYYREDYKNDPTVNQLGIQNGVKFIKL